MAMSTERSMQIPTSDSRATPIARRCRASRFARAFNSPNVSCSPSQIIAVASESRSTCSSNKVVTERSTKCGNRSPLNAASLDDCLE